MTHKSLQTNCDKHGILNHSTGLKTDADTNNDKNIRSFDRNTLQNHILRPERWETRARHGRTIRDHFLFCTTQARLHQIIFAPPPLTNAHIENVRQVKSHLLKGL